MIYALLNIHCYEGGFVRYALNNILRVYISLLVSPDSWYISMGASLHLYIYHIYLHWPGSIMLHVITTLEGVITTLALICDDKSQLLTCTCNP